MNTVQDTQRVARGLRSVLSPEIPVFVAHSRFARKDRRGWERDLLSLFGKDRTNRPGRAVVVGTQVLEQSLDVDFDYMVTDIAPIDLLIQRTGRIHRHAQQFPSSDRPHPLPTLCVLGPSLLDFEPRQAVRAIYKSSVLARTAYALAAHVDMVDLPGHETLLIEAVYGDESYIMVPESTTERLRLWDQEEAGMDAKDRVQAGRMVLPAPEECDYQPDLSDVADLLLETADEIALTRLGAKSIDVVVIDEGATLDGLDSHIDNAVRVSSNRLRRALKETRTPEAWQRHWFLRGAVPLKLVNGKASIGGLEICYDRQYGLEYQTV